MGFDFDQLATGNNGGMTHCDIVIRFRYPWSGHEFGPLVGRISALIEDELYEYEDWAFRVGPEVRE